jgi:hypothetical protein
MARSRTRTARSRGDSEGGVQGGVGNGRDELPTTPSLRRGKLCYSRHLTPGARRNQAAAALLIGATKVSAVYEPRADEQELVPTGSRLLLELLQLLELPLFPVSQRFERLASRGYLFGRYYEETLFGEW